MSAESYSIFVVLQRSYGDVSMIRNSVDVAKIILMLDRHYKNSSRWRFSHTNIIILAIMINTTQIDKAQTHTVPKRHNLPFARNIVRIMKMGLEVQFEHCTY